MEDEEEKMNKVIDVTEKKIQIIKDLTSKNGNDFIYLDPPYYPVSKRKDGKIGVNNLYNIGDYTPTDFIKLKLRCDELTMNQVPFILHNSDCEFIRILFKDYPMIEVNESRGIKTGKGKGSCPADKCLIITNFEEKKDFMNGIEKLNKIMKGKI